MQSTGDSLTSLIESRRCELVKAKSIEHCRSTEHVPTDLHPKLGFKKHGNGTHPPMRFLGATHQCQGVLAVGFRGGRLKLLRFLALSLFDSCVS